MEKNGAGGAEISKIRHLGPKQRHFGLSKKKIYISVFVSITERKKKKKKKPEGFSTQLDDGENGEEEEEEKGKKKKTRKCMVGPHA